MKTNHQLEILYHIGQAYGYYSKGAIESAFLNKSLMKKYDTDLFSLASTATVTQPLILLWRLRNSVHLQPVPCKLGTSEGSTVAKKCLINSISS